MDSIKEKLRVVDSDPKSYLEAHTYERSAYSTLEAAEEGLLFGRAFLLSGAYERANEIFEAVLTFFDKGGSCLHRFYVYINRGVLFREMGRFEKSVKAFNAAYTLSYELDDFEYIIGALIHLGSVYNVLSDNPKAKVYLEEALAHVHQLPAGKMTGDLYNNYAYTLLEEARLEEALDYLFKAYEAYKTYYGHEEHINWIIVLGNIGETYYRLGDAEAAERYLHGALDGAKRRGTMPVMVEASYYLSKIYEDRGDFKKALDYHKLYDETRSALNKQKKETLLETFNKRFEDEALRYREEIHELRNVALKSKTMELERTLKNVSLITTIGQKLTSSMDMDEIFSILRTSVYSLAEAHLFGLAVYDDAEKKIRYKYFEEGGKPLECLEIDIYQGASLGSYCILNETDLYIADFDSVYEQYLPKKTFVPIGNSRGVDTQSIIFCRLTTEEGCVGLMTLQHYERNAYKASDFEVIKALASYVAIAISNAQKKNIINEKAKALEFLSYKDPLTGLYNRRYFSKISAVYAEKKSGALGLIMGDMNHLKLINDHYGHAVGDAYLKTAAEMLTACAEGHEVFRLGGDEFAIMVADATTTQLENMVAKIRHACDAFVFEHVPLSISLGFEIVSGAHIDVSALFSKAESKMYRDKSVFHKKEM